MKTHLTLIIALISLGLSGPPAVAGEFTKGHRFVFHAVLDGCFDDGLSTEDVSQILAKGAKDPYAYFVYSCPTCTPAIHAFEVYRSRPARFFGLKSGASTFGDGLKPDLKRQLYSTKPEERLEAINALMRGWVSRRMSMLRLSETERGELQEELALMSKKGMAILNDTKSGDPTRFKMSAFANVGACAVCTGACDMKLKRTSGK